VAAVGPLRGRLISTAGWRAAPARCRQGGSPTRWRRSRKSSGASPEFAEGWNRRATAYYLAGEYEKSIADCAEVLKRNPQHFGALSGLGQIYFKLEDYARSLAWFRRALEVNRTCSASRSISRASRSCSRTGAAAQFRSQ